MNTFFDISRFPSADRNIRAQWAPVFLTPISGSCERLVVGIAAVNAEGYHLEMANALERLHCLYGDGAPAAITAVVVARKYLERDLAKRSLQALTEPEPAVSGISIGDCREAEGASLQAVAASWLQAMSSLYSVSVAPKEVATTSLLRMVAEADVSRSGDRLPFLVCDYVKMQRDGFSNYFSQDLREQRPKRSKGGSHRVVIDFAGPRLVANFGTLKAGELTSSVHLIKRRLWDLKVERDKEPQSALSRQHEMILQRPPKDDPQVSERQQANLSEALDALETQADQEELRLVALDTVQAIGQRVLSLESAA